MHRSRKIFIAKSVAVFSVIPILLFAYATGPDPGKSGVPGESTCMEAGCHVGTAVNGGPGSVTINAGGTTYTPGVKQRVRVTVSDPDQRRWGFQLTARLATNAKTQAGTFATVDAFTQLICSTANLIEELCKSTSLQYIEHSSTGSRTTAVGAGLTFDVDWTPPATDVGRIILYAAGNAANGNLTETGDRIYKTDVTLSASGGPKPAISQNGVVNGASFQAGIAQNTWVTIRGTNLATNTRTWEGKDFDGNKLPTALDGTSVKINGKDAFVYFISPTQVNVLAPVEAGTGPMQVQLSLNGTASDPQTAQMQAFSPAFFIFQNDYIASTHVDGKFLGPTTLFAGLTTPAKPGETIILYGTGFGPTMPPIPNGTILAQTSPVTNMPTIRIGNVAAEVAFAGQSATGLYQFNVKVPDSAPNGDVAVVATVGGVSSPASSKIAIQR